MRRNDASQNATSAGPSTEDESPGLGKGRDLHRMESNPVTPPLTNMPNLKIAIDTDALCKQCGKPGRTINDLCWECIDKRILSNIDPIDCVEHLLRGQCIEIIAQNASAISKELTDSEDGTLSVGLTLKLARSNSKVCCATGLAYARRFKDTTEGQCDLPDPNQPALI